MPTRDEAPAAAALNLMPVDCVSIDADRDSIRCRRSHVDLLLAFLVAKRDGGALAPFDQADRSIAVHLAERLRESIAPVFARPWQPALPPRPMAQLVASDLIETIGTGRDIAPTDAWVDRLRAVRDGLAALDAADA